MNHLHACTDRRDPGGMTLAEIERELSSLDKIPIEQRTPNMIDRINRLAHAQKKVRFGRLW